MDPSTRSRMVAMLFSFGIGLPAVRPLHAENIIFPHVRSGISDASGIVDISLSPYTIDRSGKTDVTAVLQKAFNDHQNLSTIYLPNGTYLVSNTIAMTPTCVSINGGGCVAGPILQGQSRAGTIIKLASGRFTSAGSPKPVIFSGDGTAQCFRRGIHNLTVEVMSNNAGANGVRWFSNNQGLMSDVAIVSDDGGANIGVDLGGGEQGPCGMRDITIKGFNTGIKSDALNSVTCWNLTIENCRQYGIYNPNAPLYIDNLVSVNNPVAVRNQGAMTLLNAQLNGGTSAHSAVENTGTMYARNITAQGYSRALTASGAPTGMTVTEYVTRQTSQFSSPATSIGLPYKPMPDVPWEQDTTKWGNVWVAKGGLGTVTKSDIAALQGLIDSSRITTICIPAGRAYQIDGDVFVRGNIRRIVGTGGSFMGSGRLVVTSDGTQPVIKLERLIGIPFINQSNKTVILESFTNNNISSTGTGDFFLSDVCGTPITFNNPAQQVWAWQFNAEGGDNPPKVRVQNVCKLRIVGWKDEPNGQSFIATQGIIEILGFMYYASHPTAGQTMFEIQNGAQFALACATQTTFNGSNFSNLVSETRAGVTKMLTSSANGSSDMPLYTGYSAAIVAAASCGVDTHRPPCILAQSPAELRLACGASGRLTISWPAGLRPSRLELYSASGAHVASGVLRADDCTINGLAAGMYHAIVFSTHIHIEKSVVIVR